MPAATTLSHILHKHTPVLTVGCPAGSPSWRLPSPPACRKKFGEVPLLHAVSHLHPPPVGQQPGLPFALQPDLAALSLKDGGGRGQGQQHLKLPKQQAADGRWGSAAQGGCGAALCCIVGKGEWCLQAHMHCMLCSLVWGTAADIPPEPCPALLCSVPAA